MRSWLGVLVALAAGIALGYALAVPQASLDSGTVRARGDAAGTRVIPPHPDPTSGRRSRDERLLEDLGLEVRSLRTELRDLARSMANEARTPAVPGEPVGLGAPTDPAIGPELARWMARIDRRIEDLIKSPGSLPVLHLPPAGVRPTPLPFPNPDDVDQEEFGASHLLWSYQDVLASYGRPDIVHDGDEWEYRYKGEPLGEAEIVDMHFIFSGGYVVHIYAH